MCGVKSRKAGARRAEGGVAGAALDVGAGAAGQEEAEDLDMSAFSRANEGRVAVRIRRVLKAVRKLFLIYIYDKKFFYFTILQHSVLKRVRF